MKKITLLFVLLLSGTIMFAQSDEKKPGSDYHSYNHWSIELQAGLTKPTRPMASGYAMRTPDFWQGDIGIRYMINENFGLKADFGYNFFDNHGNANDFESTLMRTSLQGVINLGSILGFRDWTNRLNVLVHGGLGYGQLKPKEPVSKSADDLGFVVAGITPQLRLGNHFALTADVSMYGNARQDYTFDGTGKTNTRGFNGMYVNTSIGLTYYLGKKGNRHADWNVRKNQDDTDELERLQEEMAAVKEQSNENSDKMDRFLKDEDGNGIPDVLEQEMDKRMSKIESDSESASSSSTVKELIDKGYVNVYFPFDSTVPDRSSLQSLNYLIVYMKENTSARADLIGYADELGNAEYNQKLSQERAEMIKRILVEAGIDEGRMDIKGNGVDSSVDKASGNARYLVRRVTFKIK